MGHAAAPPLTAPLLVAQHAARMLRAGDMVRIEDEGRFTAVIAAEAMMVGGNGVFGAGLPRGSVLILTGHRLASIAVPADVSATYLLPLAGRDAAPARIAALVDPTAPVAHATEILSLAAPTVRQDALAAVELCRLAGLLPAAVIMPIEDGAFADVASVPVAAVTAYRRLSASTLRPVSEARVPLADAENVRIVSFRPADGGPEQLAILVGEPERHHAPLARLHSECFTGDFLGSLRCDCGDQLRGAIRRMEHEGGGVLLYLAQEGRGIGLTNKLRAYMMQDGGLDTVDANHHLGFANDERDYWAAAAMLRQVGIDRVRLLTNNPAKIAQLERYGIEVTGRVPHIFAANAHNRGYLLTKAVRSGHMLAMDDLQPPKAATKCARLNVV
jgi:GTP cyclohydrolase II